MTELGTCDSGRQLGLAEAPPCHLSPAPHAHSHQWDELAME